MLHRSLGTLFALLAVLLTALSLELPMAQSNSRYFYHEDDAHHFNRTVQMAKTGDLNPHYFNKPSLHFYLRIPVVLASVEWAKHRGELSSIKEVRTRDPYGLAGYAFTASHPTVLFWSRLQSVLFTLCLISCAFLLTYQLSQSSLTSLYAAAVVAISPEILRNAHVIGVDVLMALLCLACSVIAVWTYRNFSLSRLTLCGLVAGLACSTKYNAAPIVFVPLLVWLYRRVSFRSIIIPMLAPIVGFLIGTPYAIASISEFLNGVRYEVWHYAVAGHEGHQATPGFDQAIFYTRWLITEGVGLAPSLLALIGAIFFLRTRKPEQLITFIFPAAYTAMMISQRANFTRNMVVVIPYVALYGAIGLSFVSARFCSIVGRKAAFPVIAALSLLQIAFSSVAISKATREHRDSRDELTTWIKQVNAPHGDIAIAGPLQMPIGIFSLTGVDAFNPATTSPAKLIQDGYDFVVAPDNLTSTFSFTPSLSIEKRIAGDDKPQRTPNNPAITVFKVEEREILAAAEQHPIRVPFTRSSLVMAPLCAAGLEPHCWITGRVTELDGIQPPNGALKIQFSVMSPWANQEISIVTASGEVLKSLLLPKAGEWSELEVAIPESLIPSQLPLRLIVKELHSPASQGLSPDVRRLGIAYRLAPTHQERANESPALSAGSVLLPSP